MTAAGTSKFAQLHSSILARKGEARPWEEPANKIQWQREPVQPLPPGSPLYTPPPFQPTQKPLFEAIAPSGSAAVVAKPAAPKPVTPKPAAPKPVPVPMPFAEVEAAPVPPAPKISDEAEFDLPAGDGRAYDPERVKKCTIRMSFIDYERLGIIAVKKNVTRQHLLHEALERCFQMAAEEYRKECACVGNRESCCQD